MHLALTARLLGRRTQQLSSSARVTKSPLLNNQKKASVRLLSSGSKPGSEQVKRAGWLIAFGSVPFTYFIGLSIRESRDEREKFDKQHQELIQKRLQELIDEFEALPEEYQRARARAILEDAEEEDDEE